MLEENAPRDSSLGLPMSVGDAACVWHALDAALQKLCEARDDLEAAGCDALAEEAQELIDAVEEAYAEAEEKLTKAVEGSN